ncbi:MAG: hypothetical protein IJE48_02265 [Clostridia bacterium]|nr:hypothetical protein [Clostridia bacterium]
MKIKIENKTIKYFKKMFCYSPKNILMLWMFDFFDIIFDCLRPCLIGYAIDGLLNKNYKGIIVFAVVFLISIVINHINNIEDDVIYNDIKLKFRTDYYESAIKKDVHTAIIDANLELVDEPVELIRCFFLNTINAIVGLFVSVVYMCANLGISIGISVLILCLIFTGIAVLFNKKQLPYLRELHQLNETERVEVGSRNPNTYKKFLKNKYSLTANISKIDAKGNLWVDIIVLVILVVSLLLFTNTKSITIGIIYAGIEYIDMIVSNFSLIPDIYYDYKKASICIEKISLDV